MSNRAAAAEVTRHPPHRRGAIERFAVDGLGASFDAVAAEVGVTKGALYHHFGSKEGLVEAVYKEAIRRHAERVVAASAAGHRARAPARPRRRQRAAVRVTHAVLPGAHRAAPGGRDGAPGAGRDRPARAAQPARVHDRAGARGPARRLDRRRDLDAEARRPDGQRRADGFLTSSSSRRRRSAGGSPSSVPCWRTCCDRLHRPARARGAPAAVKAYISEDVLPAESEIADPDDLLTSWHVVERLRDRARERGIFTPHLPEEYGGLGVGVLGMAPDLPGAGSAPLAALGLNCMAPDEGNMHTLLLAGTEEQKERWLRPLAEGSIRSCFAMTEPDVASSDPTNLETTAVRDGDEWVINGRKWCITGAIGAAFSIVVAKTGADEAPATATTR